MPTRKLTLLSTSSADDTTDHPLRTTLNIDALDFRVFDTPSSPPASLSASPPTLPIPYRSAFKSNLTASLKALKSAARSFSSLAASPPPTLSPDDFLTRSIIAINPSVPFTDERMPPFAESVPGPALRRYLNPMGGGLPRGVSHTSSAPCTASIQMQTYRPSPSPPSSSSLRSPSSAKTGRAAGPKSATAEPALLAPPVPRRDMRENSDFIRIAVMEMLMRKHGKLDDRVPGRAKWALPPRKVGAPGREEVVGGVPRRWVGVVA